LQPYSHFAIAAQLEAELRPATPAHYYWGAVAVDIRVTAGLPRERTHLSPEKVLEFCVKYPSLKAFTQGYMVHILSDLVDVQALVNKRPLMRLILRKNGPKFAQNLLEEFYITRRKVQKPVTIQHNKMLNDLGISRENVTSEAEFMRPYLQEPDYKITLAYLQKVANGLNLGQTGREVERLHKSTLVKPILFYLSDLDKLNQEVLMQIRTNEAFKQICG
jgi:hypothetical protein